MPRGCDTPAAQPAVVVDAHPGRSYRQRVLL